MINVMPFLISLITNQIKSFLEKLTITIIMSFPSESFEGVKKEHNNKKDSIFHG
jgi:hypothetical protein